MKTRRIEDARAFLSAVSFCFSLSWRTSPFYTALRLLSNLLPSVIGIVTAWLGKCLLDMLSGAQLGGQREVLLLAAAMLALALLRGGVQKAGVYAQSMHEDMIQGELAAYLMEKAIGMDLEYFDDPNYYDKLTACTRDAYAIENLLWNTLSAVSAGISAFLACVVVCRANLLYGVLMIVAAVPSSIAGARYMKLLYHLSLEQINGERQKGYLQAIATSRSYAQSIRFFHAGTRLKEKYQRLWKTMFEERRDMNRRRSILTSLLEFLPEAVAAWVGVDISMQILAGSATVGDYSLYTGLAAQLWSSVSLLLSAVMQIYDNQLKITNLKSIRQFQNHVLDTGTRPLSAVRSIEFDEVCFSYPKTGRKVLDRVSFAIRPGEKVAVVGLNGSGKSTLIKVLTGVHTPEEGEIFVDGQKVVFKNPVQSREAGIACVYQELNIVKQLSVTDNVFMGRAVKKNGLLDYPRMYEEAKQALTTLGHPEIDVKMECGKLGTGQQQMVEIAKAVSLDAKLIIMDEPTSSLGKEEINQLMETVRGLKAKGVAILFVSHKLEELFELCDRVTVMRDGEHIITEDTVNLTEDSLINAMVGRTLDNLYPKEFGTKGEVWLEAKGLNEAGVLHDVSFKAYGGQITGFAGLVGAGRTETMRAIFGADRLDSGEIYVKGEKVHIRTPKDAIKKKIAFLTEDRKGQGLVLSLDVRTNLILANMKGFSNGPFLNKGKIEKSGQDNVESLRIKTPSLDEVTAQLSGGNQQKVVIGKWVNTDADIFIFDEPTRGIDVGAKALVLEALKKFNRESGVTVVMISSELEELRQICDRIAIVSGGRVAGILPADHSSEEFGMLMVSQVK